MKAVLPYWEKQGCVDYNSSIDENGGFAPTIVVGAVEFGKVAPIR
ncbi:hypothetical protein SB775_10940 [Peribacillus sp. SIMBA_075]